MNVLQRIIRAIWRTRHYEWASALQSTIVLPDGNIMDRDGIISRRADHDR
jgi:hypothetical protein